MLQHLILWKDYRYTREWIRNIPRQWKYKTLVDGRWTFENGSSHPEKAKIGTADFLMGLENKRAIKVSGKSTIIGLGVAIFAGACFSLFSPAFNLATNDQWHTMKAGVPHLVVYTAFFYFTLSWFIISIILTMSFLYNPIFKVPKSSLTAYLKDCDGRLWALLAGLLCGLANCFQFMPMDISESYFIINDLPFPIYTISMYFTHNLIITNI